MNPNLNLSPLYIGSCQTTLQLEEAYSKWLVACGWRAHHLPEDILEQCHESKEGAKRDYTKGKFDELMDHMLFNTYNWIAKYEKLDSVDMEFNLKVEQCEVFGSW